MLPSPKQFEQCIWVLIGLLSVWAVGCQRESSDELTINAKAARVSVNVIEVNRETEVVESSIFFGTVVPDRTVPLGFPAAGPIKTIGPTVGQWLKTGDPVATLEQTQQNQELLELDSAIEQVKAIENPTRENLAQIKALDRQREQIKAEIATGQITAPLDGLVSTVHHQPGEFVPAGRPVVTMVSGTPLKIETNLPTQIAERIAIGKVIWCQLNDQAVAATVVSIAPIQTVFGSNRVSCTVDVSLEDVGPVLGRTVKIRFVTPAAREGYWVPLTALSQQSAGQWSVLTVVENAPSDTSDDGVDRPTEPVTIRQALVTIGQLEDRWALVDGDLNDGQRIVVDGRHRIVAGQDVLSVDVTDQYPKPSTDQAAGASE